MLIIDEYETLFGLLKNAVKDNGGIRYSVVQPILDQLVSMVDCISRCGGVGLVVLSRRELRLAVTSSPLRLPEWFPVMAGKEVAARIDDMTWSVHVRLSDEAVAVNDLQRILHELDKAIAARIQEALKSDHRHVQALRDRICRQGEDDFSVVPGPFHAGRAPSKVGQHTLIGTLTASRALHERYQSA